MGDSNRSRLAINFLDCKSSIVVLPDIVILYFQNFSSESFGDLIGSECFGNKISEIVQPHDFNGGKTVMICIDASLKMN